ncbi:MAG TPA: EVE domain-containing protein [Kofleriaceae bacterium]|jgi:predicted RNA-binding protein with PUA-like domain
MRHWLMKSEPDTFSIDNLERVRVEPWSGVRSFFARAYMRAMSVGDMALFYHSSVQPPGVAGLAKIVRVGVVDETQFDPKSQYFEEKATREAPVWDCVDVEFVERFPYYVTINRIRKDPELAQMVLLKPGRLSVQPVEAAEFARIVEMGNTEPPPGADDKPKATPKAAVKKTSAKPTSRPKRPAASKAPASRAKQNKPRPRSRSSSR